MMMQSGGGGGGSSSSSSHNNNMIVAVRIRPLSPREVQAGAQKCCKAVKNQFVVIAKSGIAGRYLRSQQGSSNEYAFDVAFDADASQADVYAHTAKPHVPSVLDGYNVTVFAYGATGAGKTHTMMGSERNGDAATLDSAVPVTGVIPQALVDIFDTIKLRQRTAPPTSLWKVFVSYMEVYNEQIYDLIGSNAGRGQPLALREDPSKGVVVAAGLSELPVHNTDQVLDLLRLGNRNRKTEATAANQVSSRSHAVLQICVRFTTVDAAGNDLARESRLSLIDLAGSERASATLNRGARLQEGANINKSLLALANCINALAENSGSGAVRRGNVKYRDSKLTHLLKSSLEGQCKLIMIANVNPCDSVFEDSHNTLKYANRAKMIKIKPGEVRLLTQEVPWHEREARLKADNETMRRELEELKACLLSQQQQQHGGCGGGASSSSLSSFSRQLAHRHDTSSLLMEEGGGGGMSTMLEEDEEDEEEEEDDDERNHTDTGFSTSFQESGKGKAVEGSSGDTAHRVRELEAMVQEMTRSRKLQKQLVASLEGQKKEKEKELQAQRQVVQAQQQELREKDQEIASLREMVVHLRTRIDSELNPGMPSTYAFCDDDEEEDTEENIPPMQSVAAGKKSSTAAAAGGGGGGARARNSSRGRSSVPMEEAMGDLFSPIKTVTVLGVASSSSSSSAAAAKAARPTGRKPSMTTGGGAGAMAPTLSSSARAPASAAAAPAPAVGRKSGGVKRRQSHIPRPVASYSTRRGSILSSANTGGGGGGEGKCAASAAGVSPSKKRTWNTALGGGEKENGGMFSSSSEATGRQFKRRESLLQKPGVAQRTRSRLSMAPGSRY